jgi:uncharacterized iron-regulated membrane protein
MRVLVWLHRYLGVAIGLVMTLWCLSGFVMLYHGYPALAPGQRLAGLETLDLTRHADPQRLDLGEARIDGFSIEMLAGRLVLRVRGGGAQTIDLTDGRALMQVPPPTALTVARDFANGVGLKGTPQTIALIDKDQWTLEGAPRRGPVYRIGLNDPAGGVLYVSRRSGAVVQATDRASRFWGRLGAVPHWLYPTILRQHAQLWDAVVVWIALIGCFLTATGLWLGVLRLGRYPGGRWSPYRGWQYWHHLAGLFFGVLTLTWVASGLFTVNPWGFLETSVGQAEQRALEGGIDPADLKRFLAAPPAPASGRRLVSLESAPLDGRLFVLERFADGSAVRVDGAGHPAPLGQGELAAALGRLDGPPLTGLTLMRQPDAYYYPGYDNPASLPIWRAQRPAPDGRAYYFDPMSGDLVLALDATARTSRWLRTGLHDLDFPGVRARPIWDIVVLILLFGVTVSCFSGAWIGVKRFIFDVGRLWLKRTT